MLCWICNIILLDQEYVLLPEKENNFEIPQKNNTYEIKTVDKFVFLYYTMCFPCVNMYLDNYPFDFKKIIKRENTC